MTVVVGNATVVATKDAPQVMALAVPSSVNLISSLSPSEGVPDRLVVIEVIAVPSPVKFIISTLSVFVVGVAPGAFVVVSLLVTLLFVSVFVEDMEGTTTPSTASTPAALLERVVSEAAPSSMVPAVTAVDVPNPKEVMPAIVMSLPVWVMVASPLSQFITPPSARNRSENIEEVEPRATVSVIVGTILVVMVGAIISLAVKRFVIVTF